MKHNLLKSVILSVILFMGVSNVWGSAGIFYGQINLEKDGGEYIAHTNNYSTAFALGKIQNLSIKATYSKVWKDNGGDITSTTLGYKLYSSTKEYIPETLVRMEWSKNFDNSNDQEWSKEGINSNLTSNLVPGDSYTLEFWFYANGKYDSNSNSEIFWLSNYSNNYKITFTYNPVYTVTLAGTDYGTYKVKCGNETYTVGKTPIPINNVPAGTQLTITDIKPNDGYDKTMVYKIGEGDYTEFGQEKTLTITNNTIISEDFRTTEEHDIYLKINSVSYKYWINEDNNALPRILFVHGTNKMDQYTQADGGNLEKKIRNFEKIVETSAYNIYKVTAPIGYHSFFLYPPHNYTASNLFSHAIIPEDPIENCFEPTTADPEGVGDWIGATITTQPTGKDTDSSNGIGRYGIEYNGTTHYATTTTSQNASFTVPYGANIRVLKGEPGNETYTGSLITNANVDANLKDKIDTIYFKNNAIDTIIKVIKDIEFNDFFVTKKAYVVYLGVPSTIKNSWENNDATNKSLAYAEHQYNTSRGAICLIEDQITINNVTYYKFTIPAGWNNLRFELKNKDLYDKYGNAPIHATIRFPYEIPTDINNCFTLTGGSGHNFTGEWGKMPNYTVQLGYCEFGEYSVMCNGIKYTSTPNKEIEFEAPYGSEITFVEGTPLQDIYKGGWMLREFNGSDDEKTRLDVTEPYIVTGDILLDDNFVTRNERVFYFAVPETLAIWNQTVNSNKAEYYIWTYDDVRDFPMYESTCHGTPVESYNGNGYKYYKFTLSAERNAFRFEHKLPSQNTNNQNPTLGRTFTLKFEVPTTEKNCYYLTGEYTTSNGYDYYNGYWDILPIDDDQYRLLYVEQVVEKDKENNTILTRKKAHPSDIFKKEDITSPDGKLLSLHVYRERQYTGICWYDEEGKNHKYYTTQASNAGVILQKTVGGKWVDISNHMVFGPLEGVPEVALLPGRKNAAKSTSSANFDYLYYDDGIENIKKDEHPDKGNGVWNFVVKKNNQGEVYIALDETHRYEGDYYIRTLATANDGWENYTDHKMTRSDISKVHSNYSHYFCKWIEQAGTNVQFTVANKYGCAISDTLMSDRTDLRGERTSEAEKIVRGLTLPKKASVRFSWNEKTNFIHRAYLGGSTDVYERFLVLKGSGDDKLFGMDRQLIPEGNGSRYGLNANEEIFNDVSNWVYYADVNMIPKAQVKLTADLQWTEGGKNMEVVQHFIGSADAYCDTILNGSGEQQYHIRMLYDFKTNEIISAYVPGKNKTIEPIETNLMLVRQENGPASQMDFLTNNMQDVGKRSYGVLELTKASLIDNYTDDDYYRVSLYWISFPFDVAIKDIFGFGKYGTHYVIQSYNGKQRAEKGLWKDSDTNWDYHFEASSLNKGTSDEGIMKKGVGYVLALDRDLIDTENLFEGRIETIALYFPATTTIQKHIDKGKTESIEVPAHECTINRGTPKGDRRIKDSHWNVIGVPSYADPISSLKNYYRWDGQYDAYTLMSSDNGDAFKTMNAYMVQYKGNLDWSNVVEESRIAAKRNTEAVQEHHLRLELQQNGEIKDYTYITMQDEDVTTGFDFNFDLCKIINKGSNIYSIITNEESPVEVAANVLPIEETIIPLGVVISAAGEYTFAMPDGTDGIVVELIDYRTNTCTNLLLDEYKVNLSAGTNDTRFALHVKPNKTVTSVEDITSGSDSQVRKFIIDGVLYMQKDGMLYDAQGRCVR